MLRILTSVKEHLLPHLEFYCEGVGRRWSSEMSVAYTTFIDRVHHPTYTLAGTIIEILFRGRIFFLTPR